MNNLCVVITFSNLDFRCGYSPMKLKKTMNEMNIFKMRNGLHEQLVSPFRMTNEQSTFMLLMTIMYLDDNNTYTSIWKNNSSHKG